MSFTRMLAALGLTAVAALGVAEAADPAGAERQYRIARRLAADGSPQAAAALNKVVELDPSGPLADDAMVDHALLLGTASWPEQLGTISPEALPQASSFLAWVLEHHPEGDRADEARFLQALASLEPAGSPDPQAARLGLLEVASRDPGGVWDRRARYARAWSDEQSGRGDAALATYQRLIVDAGDSEAATRARAGQARLLLRRGRPGHAARLLEQAAEAGFEDASTAALRELALRRLLRSTGRLGGPGTFETIVAATEIKLFADMAGLPDGGVLLAGRRAGVLRYRADGSLAARWNLERPEAVAVSPDGLLYAAADEQLYRLVENGGPVPVAGLGDSAPVSALAVDRSGTFWLLDRKGERLLTLARGGNAPREVWRSKGRRLDGIAWDGERLVAVESRAESVLTVDAGGRESAVATALGDRPGVITADPSGTLAVLDAKLGTVTLIEPDGRRSDSFGLRDRGIARGVTVRLGMDGRLHVFDGDGAWLRSP